MDRAGLPEAGRPRKERWALVAASALYAAWLAVLVIAVIVHRLS